MKRKFSAILLIIALACSLTAGCSKKKPESPVETTTPSFSYSDEELVQEQTAFDEFLDECFIDLVTESSFTLALRTKNPENYGIKDVDIQIDSFSQDYFEKTAAQDNAWIARLNEFRYDALTTEQQYTYDIFMDCLKLDLALCENFIYYEPLSPLSGVHNEIPILFSEYPIDDEEDIKTCLTLLGQLPDYFVTVMNFEREKGKQSCFMAEHSLETVKEQCDSMSVSSGYAFLISSFEQSVNAVDTLDEDKKASYISQLKTAVEQNFTMAYTYLSEELDAVAAEYGCNNAGLSQTAESRAYYSALIETYTGSGKTIEELIADTELAISEDLSKMYSTMLLHPDAIDKLENITFPCEDDNAAALNYLIEKMESNFPKAPTTSYELKDVDSAMEDMLSPAFYLIPPIDDIDNNVIYINHNPDFENMDLFATLAHEGFPGHLYQTTYFNSTNPHPLRQMLGFSGYQEGWAKYVEVYSYQWAGLDEGVATLLALDQTYGFGIYCRIDMGIHYEGWTYNDVKRYLVGLGINELETIDEIYYTLLADPGVYLQYHIGYLEIKDLYEYASDSLGSLFSELEFHKFLLDIGPSQFYLIREKMEDWIKTQKKF